MSAVRGRPLGAAVVSSCLVLAAACAPRAETPPAADSAAAAQRPAPPAPLGAWLIALHHIPGTSAMTDAEAAAMRGRIVRFDSTEARSDTTACATATYATRRTATATLAADYNVSPASLPPIAEADSVTVVETSCGGAPWVALGGRFLQLDSVRALAPWNGVFFELGRVHDVRAVGQEPGWLLQVRPGKEMRFTHGYGEGEVVTPGPVPGLEADGSLVYLARADGHTLQATVALTPCTDAMSGEGFPRTVTVVLDGKTFRGCGR